MKLLRFQNEPFLDFSKPQVAKRMRAAIDKVRSSLGKEYDLVIGGKRKRTNDKLRSINPSNKNEVVGIFQKAGPDEAHEAVELAYRAFQDWQFEPAAKRVARMLKVAKLLRARRYELAAWIILEAGKTWSEADADVAEAIDLADFYAREAWRISGPQKVVPYPGEKPELRYIPLGVGVVIPPWNFPLAILSGMTFATLVTGNTAIIKPSSDTPGIAAQLYEILVEADFPEGVVNYVSGGGAVCGNAMVAHPRTRFVAFTGSKDVGLGIVELAAKTQPGQLWIKRVIAEMGGKNAIIVDETADLDWAVQGVRVSAYGYQGQKCSACSRLVLLDKIHDVFMEKLIPSVEEIELGPAEDPVNFMGPVINQAAYDSIMGYIEVGKNEGKLLAGGTGDCATGFFIRPTVFDDVAPHARLGQEEIFGPVLAVMRARDFDHALEIANFTEYGLTGAVYSRDRKRLERAKERFFCGNLYLNRKCTGALVGVHPFGGFNMSGTDSKAGGSDYLLLFTQAKAISEKILDKKK